MAVTSVTSREFNQDVSKAKRAATEGPVFITDRGRPAHVLLTIAQRCAKLHVPDPRSDRDALIAATALVHGMPVVTHNVQDFIATGVELLNPWQNSRNQT